MRNYVKLFYNFGFKGINRKLYWNTIALIILPLI